MKIAIVGATGLVGRIMIEELASGDFNIPIHKLFLIASGDSVGKKIRFKKEDIYVHSLIEQDIPAVDIALFAVNSALAVEYVPEFIRKGAIVIDNSSAFRLEENVPLIVPEVNPDLITNSELIANPNCSTIQLVVVLKPLMKFGLAKVFVATYQGISGAGKDALTSFIKECKNTSEHIQNVSLLNILGKNPVISDESIPYFGNVIPAIGNLNSCGDSAEETKLKLETRKILNIPDMQIFVTSVRVPVINAHSEVVFVEFECEIEYKDIVSSLQSAEGIKFVEPYPTPIYVTGRRKVYVGRIRQDTENKQIYQFFIVADNLRKGAATNALQIAEEISKRKSV